MSLASKTYKKEGNSTIIRGKKDKLLVLINAKIWLLQNIWKKKKEIARGQESMLHVQSLYIIHLSARNVDRPTMDILPTLYKLLRNTENGDRDVVSSQRRKRRLQSLENSGKVRFWEVEVMVESESSS